MKIISHWGLRGLTGEIVGEVASGIGFIHKYHKRVRMQALWNVGSAGEIKPGIAAFQMDNWSKVTLI